MRYGIPYQASKNTIAEWVVSNLPRGERFVDLFAGGCAVTHCAMLSGKYRSFLANDLGQAPEIFQAAINGEFRGYCTVPDREQFNAEKDDDYVLALLNSFGNGKQSFLWSKELEQVKVHASRMLAMPSQYERRMEYKKFLKALNEYVIGGGTIDGVTRKEQRLQGLQGLEGLERLERLERLEGLQGFEISKMDYRRVPILAGDVVYADPPYRNTSSDCDDTNGFNYEEFDEWLQTREFPVYVSEYTCPKGCIELDSTMRRGTLSGGGAKKTQEKIFVQEKFKDVCFRRDKTQNQKLDI